MKKLLFLSTYLAAIVIIIYGLCLTATNYVKHSSYKISQYKKLMIIKNALYYYANDHDGSFPPAYTTDSNGLRMHSWRVLLLPYLSEHELYAKIKLNEPCAAAQDWRIPGGGEIMTLQGVSHEGIKSTWIE